jgi:hypothetical protein
MKGLEQPDERSFGVYKMLTEVYPAFADKLFQNNAFMQRLVMSGMNPMDILDYPICGRCETLAPYNGYAMRDGRLVPKCTCMSKRCGHTTVNPVTLRDWIKYEMKKRVTEDFYEAIEVAVDQIAYTMVCRYQSQVNAEIARHSAQTRAKRGILMPDGTEHVPSVQSPAVEHYHDGKKPRLPKDSIILSDDE